MNKYYFTFMNAHVLRDYVRPIVAPSAEIAMEKMFELYGKDWGFDYTEKQFLQGIVEGSITERKELDTIYCGEFMTVGDMLQWTKRYNQILSATQCKIKKRLIQLRSDLVGAYKYEEPFAYQFLKAIEEVI